MYAHCTHATNPTFVHARGCPRSYPRNPTLRAKQLKTSIRTPVFSGAGGSANRSEGASSQRRGYQGQPRCRVCAIFKQWIGSGIGRSCSALKEEQTPAHNNGRVQEGRWGLASEQEPCFGNAQRFTLVNFGGISILQQSPQHHVMRLKLICHPWMIEHCPAHLREEDWAKLQTKRTAESASQDEETHDHHKCLDLCVSQKPPSQDHSGHHLHSSGCSLFSLKLHIFCVLLVQGKYSCPYSKCEWICSIRDKHCCAKAMNTHQMKGKKDCLLFAIITSSRPCLWGSQGSPKKGCFFLGFLS